MSVLESVEALQSQCFDKGGRRPCCVGPDAARLRPRSSPTSAVAWSQLVLLVRIRFALCSVLWLSGSRCCSAEDHEDCTGAARRGATKCRRCSSGVVPVIMHPVFQLRFLGPVHRQGVEGLMRGCFWAVCTGTRPWGHVHRDMAPVIRCTTDATLDRLGALSQSSATPPPPHFFVVPGINSRVTPRGQDQPRCR